MDRDQTTAVKTNDDPVLGANMAVPSGRQKLTGSCSYHGVSRVTVVNTRKQSGKIPVHINLDALFYRRCFATINSIPERIIAGWRTCRKRDDKADADHYVPVRVSESGD